jgi:hypothetical protein
MSILHVCVDRGRLLVREPSVVRVEGSTTFVAIAGPWFRCRLFYEGAPSEADPQGGHWRDVSNPQVLAPMKALDGSRIEFRSDYRLHVHSRELGHAVWRMTGDPEPLRKRRRIIGWLATVERVIEPIYDDLLQDNMPLVPALGEG